jgi:hypothetical protein
MAEGGITKLQAAQRQLDCALRLRREGGDSLAVHTLAYAAYCLLRDLYGKSETKEVLRQFEKSHKLDKVPNFLKHADRRPQAILKKHSETSTYTTLALAIRLWKDRGQPETAEMRSFSALPDPFKSGRRASKALQYVREGPISDLEAAKAHFEALLVTTSTQGALIVEEKDEREDPLRC